MSIEDTQEIGQSIYHWKSAVYTPQMELTVPNYWHLHETLGQLAQSTAQRKGYGTVL